MAAGELTNGVINSCFILLFRDLIRLFACYNDGIINLLGWFFLLFLIVNFLERFINVWFAEKYFDMNKKQCREALDTYKVFLQRMDRVAEFLKVAEVISLFLAQIKL